MKNSNQTIYRYISINFLLGLCAIALVFLLAPARAEATGDGQQKYCLCHHKGHDPDKPKETISVAEPAVCDPHMEKGDTAGPCPGDDIEDCKGAPPPPEDLCSDDNDDGDDHDGDDNDGDDNDGDDNDGDDADDSTDADDSDDADDADDSTDADDSDDSTDSTDSGDTGGDDSSGQGGGVVPLGNNLQLFGQQCSLNGTASGKPVYDIVTLAVGFGLSLSYFFRHRAVKVRKE